MPNTRQPTNGTSSVDVASRHHLRIVLALLAFSVFINYIDRANLSTAASMLKDELGISPSQLGILLSAFFFTYALFLIISGWLVDRFNVNWVMAIGFFLWSAATGVGIERDTCSIARANARVAKAGLMNVKFLQTDVNHIQTEKPFDAVVGRFILMFLPDPTSVLRLLLQVLKPGGTVAFQEPSWKPFLAFNAQFSLYSKLLNAIYETFLRSGVNPEMGPDLHRVFQDIGLPVPAMHMDTALGSGSDFISIGTDVLVSLAPVARQHKIPLEDLGSLATVAARIHDEVSAANKIASLIRLVGVWARKPMNA